MDYTFGRGGSQEESMASITALAHALPEAVEDLRIVTNRGKFTKVADLRAQQKRAAAGEAAACFANIASGLSVPADLRWSSHSGWEASTLDEDIFKELHREVERHFADAQDYLH